MSSRKLTKDQIDVFKLGLKFCPTPKSNIPELKKDLKDFERKFRLKEFFYETNYEEESLVKNKSKFQPEKGRDKILDKYFENLWNSNFTENSHVPNNLSFKQRKALKEIQNAEDIIIKEADKGSAVVIMNKEFYEKKINEMVNDETNYKTIDSNEDKCIISKIIKLCNKYKEILTKKEADYLVNFDHKTSNFYGLPKIHKSEIIKEAKNCKNQSLLKF